MKISFVEDYKTNKFGEGYGLGSVDIETETGGTVLNWREDEVRAINQIPSPYEDPYGFFGELLSLMGVDYEIDITYKESETD